MQLENMCTVQLKDLIQERIRMLNAVMKVCKPEDNFYKERQKALQDAIDELNKRK